MNGQIRLESLAAHAPDCEGVSQGVIAWWQGEALTETLNGGSLLTRNGATVGAGFIGSGFHFPGGGSAFVFSDAFKFPGPTFSLETWFRRERSDVAGFDAEGAQFLGGSVNGASFGLTHDGRLYVRLVGIVSYYSTTSVRDTDWHHAAVVREGGTLTFYLDGQPANALTCPAQFRPDGPHALGGLGTAVQGVFQGFLGSMDEFSVYNIGLTTSSVMAIYRAGASGKCSLPLANFSLIPVANPGFEELNGADLRHFDDNGRLRDGHYSVYSGFPADINGFARTDAIPGWIGPYPGGTVNPEANLFYSEVPDGSNVAWLNLSGTIRQILTTTYQAGSIYRLEVMVGHLNGGAFPGFEISLFAGGQPLKVEQNSVPIPAGIFVPVSTTAEVSAGSSAVGKPIEIRLSIPGTGQGQVNFDRVRLWVTPSSPISTQLPPLITSPVGPNIVEFDPIKFKSGTIGRPYTATFVVRNPSPVPRTEIQVQLQVGPGLSLLHGVLEAPGGSQVFALDTPTPSVSISSLPAHAQRNLHLTFRSTAASGVIVLGTSDPLGTAAELPCQLRFESDSDADGIPDSWEVAFNMKPLDFRDATQDADGDGTSNLGEYETGTSPRNPQDVLQLTANLRRNGQSGPWTTLNLSFPTRLDRVYHLQARAANGADWVDAEGPLAGTGGDVSREFTVRNPLFPSDDTTVFYRVLAEFLR